MGFKCGIVGLPNVGKSTLFNALTCAGIQAENYPFCTIEPNVGVIAVPDQRVDQISAIVKPQRIVPTTMEFVDIAGLVAGAAKGEGLGNKFLANIRETHAIAHVVRCFEDDEIIHVSDSIDPLRDIEVINIELALADLESVEKSLHRVNKLVRTGQKDAKQKQELLEKVGNHLNQNKAVRSLGLDAEEMLELRDLHLLTLKPVMYIANIAEDDVDNNRYLDQVKHYAEAENSVVVPICAAIETEITELSETERQEFLDDMGLEEPGLNRVIRAGYALLGLQTYFTAGVKEVRAWTIKKGDTASRAAGVIHTDFEKGFIRAEVISFQDYVDYKGEQGAKDVGKWRLEGKDSIIHDGDVIHFRFNV